MDSCHNEDVSGRNVTMFWSNAKAPFHLFSNFAHSPLTIDGIKYPCTEAAFQAQRVKPEYREVLFSINSEIGQLNDAGFVSVGCPPEAAAKKVIQWGKKGNVGILAKMKIKQIDPTKMVKMTLDECESVFKGIVLEKFRTNETARKTLMETNEDFLVEFDRGAGRTFRPKMKNDIQKVGKVVRWGAMIVDGRVVGHNQMGSLLMWVRGELKKEFK